MEQGRRTNPFDSARAANVLRDMGLPPTREKVRPGTGREAGLGHVVVGIINEWSTADFHFRLPGWSEKPTTVAELWQWVGSFQVSGAE